MRWVLPPALLAARGQKGMHAGLRIAGEMLRRDAANTVPHDVGILEGSARVTQQGNEVAVSYDTPYAVYQHERPLRHPGKGRQRWLERTLNEKQQKYQNVVAKEIRKAFR